MIGYYSIAEKILQVIRQLLSVFSQAIYPQVCQLALKSKEEVISFIRNFFRPLLGLIILMAIVIFFFSDFIALIILGQENSTVSILLKMISIIPVIICLNIPSYQLLLGYNRLIDIHPFLFRGRLLVLC